MVKQHANTVNLLTKEDHPKTLYGIKFITEKRGVIVIHEDSMILTSPLIIAFFT